MAMTLQQIADRIEIDDVLTRYAAALDAKDWDLFSTCFTPDAAIDYTAAGGIKGTLPEVRAWLAEVMVRFPMTQHLVTNRSVHVDGRAAVARYVFNDELRTAIVRNVHGDSAGVLGAAMLV